MSHEEEGRASEVSAPRFSSPAVAALVLGLLSLVLLLLAALPALYLGVMGVRAVNQSDGRLRGRRLALAGLALAGFTLLATVLGIVALVLIQLQIKSDRAGCANHLRQIGLSVDKYCDMNDLDYPSAVVPNPALPPEKRLSWLAAIGPYLAGETPAGRSPQPALEAIDPLQAWDAPANERPRQANVASFLCPAFVRASPHGPGLTSYVGLAGINPDAAALPEGHPRAGFFGCDRTLSWLDLPPGSSSIVTAAETTLDNGPWLAGGPATVRGLDPDRSRYIGFGQPFGGLHPGGMNVLWADASVRFVTENVTPEYLRSQVVLTRPEE